MQAASLHEYQLWLIEAEEQLQDFLTRKIVENESLLKDGKIREMQDEMLRQQQMLIQQNRKLEELNAEEKKTTEALEQRLRELALLKEKQEEERRQAEELIAKQEAELQALRKKKSKCVIL